MSDIKMCDNCGSIFPTTKPGWTQYTQTIIRDEDDHSPTRPTKTYHTCQECAGQPKDVAPRLPDASLALMAARAEVDEVERRAAAHYGGTVPGERRHTE